MIFQLFEFSEYEKYMIAHWVGRPYEVVCALAWLFVGFATIWATFSPKIRDTVCERIALAFISISSFSRAFFVFDGGMVPFDGVLTAVSIALYCAVIWFKHQRLYHKRFLRRRDDVPSFANKNRRKDDCVTDKKS